MDEALICQLWVTTAGDSGGGVLVGVKLVWSMSEGRAGGGVLVGVKLVWSMSEGRTKDSLLAKTDDILITDDRQKGECLKRWLVGWFVFTLLFYAEKFFNFLYNFSLSRSNEYIFIFRLIGKKANSK